MQIAICDGNTARGDDLLHLVRQVLCDRPLSYAVRRYKRLDELLCDAEEGESFEVVFLAAEHIADTPTNIGQLLKDRGCSAWVVLTAENSELAVRGYDAGAVGFLVYPLGYEAVARVLDRLLRDTGAPCLTVRRNRTVTRVPLGEILYVESRNAKCIVHCRDAVEHVMYAHLDDIECRLADRRFLRCHQSYLVNMDHIVRADVQFEVSGGAVVSIRQRDQKRIRDHYLSYIERSQI